MAKHFTKYRENKFCYSLPIANSIPCGQICYPLGTAPSKTILPVRCKTCSRTKDREQLGFRQQLTDVSGKNGTRSGCPRNFVTDRRLSLRPHFLSAWLISAKNRLTTSSGKGKLCQLLKERILLMCIALSLSWKQYSVRGMAWFHGHTC